MESGALHSTACALGEILVFSSCLNQKGSLCKVIMAKAFSTS